VPTAIQDPAPDWIKQLRPENKSVLDPWWKAPARTVVSLLGLDDPQSQVMGIAAGIETKEAQALLQRFPRLAKALESIQAARLEPGLQGEAGYAYHATNAERLADIAESGKLNVHRPDYGTDQSVWPDLSSEKRAYFGASPERLYQFAPEEGMPVVLRTKQDQRIFVEKTGDLFSRKPISAQTLEFLGDDGQWHGLDKLAR